MAALAPARDTLKTAFIALYNFVHQKGFNDFFARDDTQILSFDLSMNAYNNWLQGVAEMPNVEKKTAVAMRKCFWDDKKNAPAFTFAKKYGVLYGEKDTNYGDDAIFFQRQWILVFEALQKYTTLLRQETSWTKFFSLRRNQPAQQNADVPVEQLLSQLKQCIEE